MQTVTKLSGRITPLIRMGANPMQIYNEVLQVIAEANTVDAVEVVRCKDCKHCGWAEEPCHGRTQRFCKLHKGLVVIDRDTFCSYGEMKGDGNV